MAIPYATLLIVREAMHSRISQGHYTGVHLLSGQLSTVEEIKKSSNNVKGNVQMYKRNLKMTSLNYPKIKFFDKLHDDFFCI